MSDKQDRKNVSELPSEIQDLYHAGDISFDEIFSITIFRQRLLQSAPRPRKEFREELFQSLQNNLYPDNPVLEKKHHRFTGALRKRIVSGVFILLIYAGLVLAADDIINQMLDADTGLKSAYETNDYSEIVNVTTAGEFTLNLQWTNADTNRLTLVFNVSGYGCEDAYIYCHARIDLRENSYGSLPVLDGRVDTSRAEEYVFLYNFDVSDLNLDDRPYSMNLSITPYGVSILESENKDSALVHTYIEFLSDPMELPFTIIPSATAKILNLSSTVVSENTEIVLKQIRSTQTQTRMTMCFLSPDTKYDWTIITSLRIDDHDIVYDNGVQGVISTDEVSDETCSEIKFNIPLPSNDDHWRLEVTELVGFIDTRQEPRRIEGSWVFDSESLP